MYKNQRNYDRSLTIWTLCADNNRPAGTRDCFWLGLYKMTDALSYNFTVGGSIPAIPNHYPFVGGEPNVLEREPYAFLSKENTGITRLINSGGQYQCKISCESKYYRPN